MFVRTTIIVMILSMFAALGPPPLILAFASILALMYGVMSIANSTAFTLLLEIAITLCSPSRDVPTTGLSLAYTLVLTMTAHKDMSGQSASTYWSTCGHVPSVCEEGFNSCRGPLI